MSIIRRTVRLPIDKNFFTALLSGGEGGLATTTAIIAGLLITTEQTDLVVTTAVISFLVQAFNGAIGRFSAEHTEDEIMEHRKWYNYSKPARSALVQFLSHVFMSILVLIPIVMVTNIALALTYAILITLFFLFLFGAVKGRMVQGNPWRDGLEMVILGAMIISVGIVAGILLHQA